MTNEAEARTVPAPVRASAHGLRVVVMGVSGAGKSTVGALLAARLGLPFVDGDDLHPAANIAKMAAGIPLDDDDRWGWLDAVAEVLARPGGAVVAASVLKRRYRDRVRAGAPGTRFVELRGTLTLLRSRLEQRADHFMPPQLLASQFAAWEPLADDEDGLDYDVALEPDAIAEAAATALTGSTTGERHG
ncbi:gluconokinase [Agromyces tardus]|jgi:gluconokinase|uniref:Gluconokinase n=1 Tax=Agromyces tardus TaxID=2583849 RepID=A0A3M8AKY9_9MICO|nr:gluconokinase [Agromyces tardus]RNB51287.1 gluconokinase [Agromyces tardus]